jgi:hypothetical protein
MKTPPQRSSELLHTRGRQLLRAFTDRRPSGNGLGYWSQGRFPLLILLAGSAADMLGWMSPLTCHQKIEIQFSEESFFGRDVIILQKAISKIGILK